MEFQIEKDMEIIQDLLEMTLDELADAIGVSRMTLYRWAEGKGGITPASAEAFYGMIFRKGIRLNRIKEQFYREDYADEERAVLFHGAKKEIEGKLELGRARKNNDFGQGFYCGESLEQSAMFVSGYPASSLYVVSFRGEGLRRKLFHVNRDWMLTIAYFRGKLKEFEGSPVLAALLRQLEGIDYIVAPIADNRMFEIIDSFIEGEITDIQCRHCLSATNLGSQYVFVTQEALSRVELLERCYLAKPEKEYYLRSRHEAGELNRDKVRVARRQYRGQGKYIEEILA